MNKENVMPWVKYLPFLFLMLGCESAAEDDPFESRMHMLMRRKDSLVRLRNTAEKNLGSYEKSKSLEVLMTDTAYALKVKSLVLLDQQLSLVTHEIRQVEKERITNKQKKE